MSRRSFATGLVALVMVGACAETTVDPVETAVAPSATSTTRPSGTTAELLDRLIAEAGGLSELVVDGDGEEEALARVEALWAAAQPAVEEARPDLVEQFEQAMDYARRAVERRRPADADKAAQNLRTLADTL